MTHPKFRRFLIGISIVLVFVALALIAGQVSADTVTPRTIQRELAPVIVRGDDLSALHGASVDSLFVYHHTGGNWEQIPFQVDRMAGGVYTDTTDGMLGPMDEIVFMTADLGDRSALVGITSALAISPTWYQVEVTDPLSPTLKGWAYIVRSESLTKTFTQTYASFDIGSSQIRSERYALGFADSHPGFEYLALNDSGTDILDRTKIRLRTVLGTVTEDDIGPEPIDLTKDGPVRVIARGGAVIGYHGIIKMSIVYPLPMGVTGARLSTDFNADVASSTFYNANIPGGVTIDGNPDTVAPTPLSTWWQVSGDTGTLVQVADPSGVGGIQTNYYKDDDTLNPSDPGDNKSYGDTGIKVNSPHATVVYHSVYAVLPPNQPNVGAAYAARVAYPVDVAVTTPVGTVQFYLPVVMKN